MISVLLLRGRREVGPTAWSGLLVTQLAPLEKRSQQGRGLTSRQSIWLLPHGHSQCALCFAQSQIDCAGRFRPFDYFFLEPNKDEKPDLDCSEVCCCL